MTQIATDKEQSKRLLDCGVSPYTADMTLWDRVDLLAIDWHHGALGEEDIPAWSLSALLALLPMEIRKDGIDFTMELKPYPHDEECCRWCISYYDNELKTTAYYSEAPDPIEACVRMVVKLTDNGYKPNETKR